jgi:hypothetical protein
MQFEQEASSVRYFNPALIPGLLQTPAYAAGIFSMHPAGLDEETIRVRIDAREERRERMLSRPQLSNYLIILDESVLHRVIGGTEVMAEQLREVLKLMRRSSFLVRILPFGSSGPMALLGPFMVLDMGDEGEAVLYREGPQADEIVRSTREIVRHREIFERLWQLSYDDQDSVSLIEKHAESVWGPRHRSGPSG